MEQNPVIKQKETMETNTLQPNEKQNENFAFTGIRVQQLGIAYTQINIRARLCTSAHRHLARCQSVSKTQI